MIAIVDTSAWLEYFRGSPKAAKLRVLILEGLTKLITLDCCLAELKAVALRDGLDFAGMFRVIKADSIILPILQENWLLAAGIRHEMRKKQPTFGMIDALILARQKTLKAHLMTMDSHFKGLKNVILV